MKKRKLIESNAGLVNIILYICQPAVMIMAFAGKEYSPDVFVNLLLAVFFTGVIIVGMAGLGKLLFRGKTGNISAFAAAFGNIAFMGIPVIQALIPESEGVMIYVVGVLIAFNILAWTLGCYIMSGEKQYVSLKKGIVNPPTLALLVALPLFFLNIQLPETVTVSVDFLAKMTTPLSMIVLGMRFADIKPLTLFTDMKAYAAAAMRLIAAPLLILLIMTPFRLDSDLVIAVTITAGMPTATLTLLFSEHFKKDSGYAVKVLLLSTLLSVVTIPALMLLL